MRLLLFGVFLVCFLADEAESFPRGGRGGGGRGGGRGGRFRGGRMGRGSSGGGGRQSFRPHTVSEYLASSRDRARPIAQTWVEKSRQSYSTSIRPVLEQVLVRSWSGLS